MLMKKLPFGCYILIAFFLIVALGAAYEMIGLKIPTIPSVERSKKYVYSITGYIPPDTLDLIYSKRYWTQDIEPMTVCSVFKFSERELLELKSYSFLRSDEYVVDAIEINRGCNEFRELQSEVEKFEEYVRAGDHLRGYTVHINNSESLVMFEMYLYD